MTDRTDLARRAVTGALKSRQRAHAPLDEAVCVYDLVEQAGVPLRFLDASSMEGMYVQAPEPRIIVSSERPPGRQRFTCAHEFGHHTFGHGHRVDEYFEDSRVRRRGCIEEFTADLFADFLLMPKMAVVKGFASRGFDPAKATPEEIFVVAGWLGVSYRGLLQHMMWNLKLVDGLRGEELMKLRPKKIREDILGAASPFDVFVVDRRWTGRAVDVHVGDLLLCGARSEPLNIEGSAVSATSSIRGVSVVRAARPGTSRLEGDGWAVFARVSRRGFVGRAVFRHLEDSDVD